MVQTHFGFAFAVLLISIIGLPAGAKELGSFQELRIRHVHKRVHD